MKNIGTILVGMGCLLGMGGRSGVLAHGGGKDAVLYLFLTPECRGAPEAAHTARSYLLKMGGKIRLRPVLLVRDYGKLTRLQEGDPIQKALKELGKLGPLDIPLYDEEGLRLAEAWKVSAVPAFVLVRGGKAHRVFGGCADLEALWQCGK